MEFIDYKKKRIDDDHVEITAVAPGNYVSSFMDEAIKRLASLQGLNPESNIDDLKKQLVDENRTSEDLDQIIKGYVLSRFVPYVVDNLDDEIITEPKFFCKNEPVAGKDFELVVLVMLKPKFELTSYEPVDVTIPRMEVSDEELEEEIKNFAANNAEFEVVKDDSVTELMQGDYARFDTFVLLNGKKVKKLTNDNVMIQASYGTMPKEFIDNIVGMQKGEVREFSFSVEADDQDGKYDPVKYDARVKLNHFMRRTVPELTQEWFKRKYPYFKNLDEFKNKLREKVQSKYDEKLDTVKSLAVDYAILDRFSGEIPDEVFEFVMGNMTQNFNENLNKMGVSREQFFEEQNTTQEEYSANMMLEARRALRQGFALDSIYRNLNMELTDEDINNTLKQIAPGNEDRLFEEMKESGRTYVILEEARRNKAHQWLIDTANYTYVNEQSQPGKHEYVEQV